MKRGLSASAPPPSPGTYASAACSSRAQLRPTVGLPGGKDLPEVRGDERPDHLQRAEAPREADLLQRAPPHPILGAQGLRQGGERPPRDLAQDRPPRHLPRRTA